MRVTLPYTESETRTLPSARYSPAAVAEPLLHLASAPKVFTMTDRYVFDLRQRVAEGDTDAVAELVGFAGEHGDMDELRRLAEHGYGDAVDQLVEVATERGDLAELRRLAAGGNTDAADILAELTEERDDDAR